jgi:ribosomal protein S12 methylthiotransferase
MNLVGRAEDADLIFINTCGFIKAAKEESMDAIAEAVKLKESDSEKRIYAWGCLPERYAGEIEKTIPGIDGVFGVEPFRDIGRFLFDARYRWDDHALGERVLSTPPHTAYLKIADGCDHRCTFCSIPLFKGKYRSRPAAGLIDEAKSLVDRGVKELVLVAQDTTAYGQDLQNEVGLSGLLEQLAGVEGLRWIRVMYGHPAHLKEDVISLMAEDEKICSYLDLPLQHISDEMLHRMGRGMDSAAVRRLVSDLRKTIPDLVLRTSFIVGFPGETEAMFEELLQFVEETRFERMGAFVFSPEEGTEAARLTPEIPKDVSEERYHRLMELQQEISRQLNLSLESRAVSVLVDGFDSDQNLFFGRTPGDAPDIDQTVWIRGETRIGDIITVEIEASSAYDFLGHVKNNSKHKGAE